MKLKNSSILLLLFISISACSFFKKKTETPIIARVNETYLYLKDIKPLLTEGITKDDSLLRVNNYINQWATEQLLIDGAKFNLSEEKQQEYNNLVTQYKNDLYTKAYVEALVKQSIDTLVTQHEIEETYQSNLEIFKLNEDLIKFRYINISDSNEGVTDVEKRFRRFNLEDKKVLDSMSIQFKSYSLNDSIWIRLRQAVSKIPILSIDHKKELLKKTNFIRHKDSLGLYLMRIKDVLKRNETAPIEYVTPTIKQIIINKRKLEFVKKLETDITRDAIKNKQFEIFN